MVRLLRAILGFGLVLLIAAAASAGVIYGNYLLRTTAVRADPQRGFSSAYRLQSPGWLTPRSRPVSILVLPNNTGHPDDDVSVHERGADEMSFASHLAFAGMDVAILVPTFPRPMQQDRLYTHALDRDSLATGIAGLKRIDLQLLGMIEDARRRLEAAGWMVNPKVLMAGFSASGMFVNRFALLHPEVVQAAVIGSPGGWPIAPSSEWAGRQLTYPAGTADVADLVGRPVDLDAARQVPMLLFIGDRDDNDSVPYADSYDDRERKLVLDLFGASPVSRWPMAVRLYAAAGMNSEFRLIPGVGHVITFGELIEVRSFLKRQMSEAK